MNIESVARLDAGQRAQLSFRAVLQAMSFPGRIVTLPAACLDEGLTHGVADAPAPSPALAAVMLALLDRDTSVRLHGRLQHAALREWLRLHAGARMAQGAADFEIVCADQLDALACAGFEAGSDVAPQTGATLLIDVAGLDQPGATTLLLQGPGVAATQALRVKGITAGVWHWRLSLREQYPRGIEMLLLCGDRLAALPRSTRITVAG